MAFTLPTMPGIYFLRFYAHNTYMFLATSPPINTGPAVSVTTTLGPGGTFAAQITNGPGNAKDWVGLYVVGSSVELDWKFLNGSRSAPATGVTGATVPFALPTTPGKSYVLRYYANDTYALLAASAAITVGGSNALTVSATTVAPGGSLTATVADGPRNAMDWVGLYAVGGSIELDWKFLNGSRTAPAAGVSGAVLPFTLPATHGHYVLRFYANNTVHYPGDQPADCRDPGGGRTVESGTISQRGDGHTGWNGHRDDRRGPGERQDWIALYAADGSVELDLKFLNGLRTAPAAALRGPWCRSRCRRPRGAMCSACTRTTRIRSSRRARLSRSPAIT